ncbi:ankyrin repeat domain-containing protein 31-like [Acipenser ruthenus]|uniref:ankyrin repeat domain-containing protein 31-like n=1 Tax=Acipenser ruthenus TaxID=7906 RepID=UPI0027423B89|nr:ankyrin repeat domain-containing protein 31-like [Acipenser ruthenus]
MKDPADSSHSNKRFPSIQNGIQGDFSPEMQTLSKLSLEDKQKDQSITQKINVNAVMTGDEGSPSLLRFGITCAATASNVNNSLMDYTGMSNENTEFCVTEKIINFTTQTTSEEMEFSSCRNDSLQVCLTTSATSAVLSENSFTAKREGTPTEEKSEEYLTLTETQVTPIHLLPATMPKFDLLSTSETCTEKDSSTKVADLLKPLSNDSVTGTPLHMSSFKCLLKSQNTLPAEGESDSQENTLPNKLLTQLNSIPSRSTLDPNMNLQDEGECSAVLSSTAEEELVWQGNLSMKIEKQDALSTSNISHMAVSDECTQIMAVHFHSGMHTEEINMQSGHPMESETQEDALGSLQVSESFKNYSTEGQSKNDNSDTSKDMSCTSITLSNQDLSCIGGEGRAKQYRLQQIAYSKLPELEKSERSGLAEEKTSSKISSAPTFSFVLQDSNTGHDVVKPTFVVQEHSSELSSVTSRNHSQTGKEVDQKSAIRWTALHEASLAGSYTVALELLKAGAEVNCKGRGGITPLHHAAKQGHHLMVNLLLQNGADPLLKNDEGKTPWEEASDNQLAELIKSYPLKPETSDSQTGSHQINMKGSVECNKPERITRSNGKRYAQEGGKKNTEETCQEPEKHSTVITGNISKSSKPIRNNNRSCCQLNKEALQENAESKVFIIYIYVFLYQIHFFI